MRSTKAHYVTVRVEFDEPCTRAAAVEAFRGTVWGDYYPAFPQVMTVRGVKSAKQHKARARFAASGRAALDRALARLKDGLED